ncbi:E3 ubiquitin-protein ligase XIAP isoform X2 [Ambystoma mexicanum]|uniref:E3 ubiquitin-protein ligase XIAP isoform X2 n=1 Tax=Ambystoma mexicanum TaxID=8296 RepID=UPI0037E80035
MSDIRAAQVHGIDQLFSEESYRNKTFANFPGSCPVSSTTLARAGFYYTGDGDTVKCFSCHLTVQGWQYGESAIGKHRKLSPNCTFINSFYPNSEQIQTSSPVLQSSSPWVADNCSGSSAPGNSFHMVPNTDADYLLRTGQVVDMSDTMYPRNPAMCNEAARLASFISWPDYSPVKPKELAHAGLYYKGIADQVECFCCGGKLKNWEPGDRPLAEHKKHFPRCLFVQGRKTGVPHESNGVDEEWCILNGTEIPAHQEMTALEKRLETFQSWMFPISKQDLAKSGFYSLGDADSVMCFYCGGGLRDWKPSEDPWQQHAKWYPGCKYLIDQKGVEFVNHVQLNKGSNGDIEMEPVEEASPLNKADTINQSPMVQDALQMGFNLSTIQTLMENKLKTTGENYKSTELLVADLLNETTQDKSNEVNPPKKGG